MAWGKILFSLYQLCRTCHTAFFFKIGMMVKAGIFLIFGKAA